MDVREATVTVESPHDADGFTRLPILGPHPCPDCGDKDDKQGATAEIGDNH